MNDSVEHTLPKLSTISFTKAFMGATYTILNLSLSTDPYSLLIHRPTIQSLNKSNHYKV